MANTFEVVGTRVKEIYRNNKEEINIIDTLDKRERWVANYIINNWIKKEFLIRFDDKQIRNVDYILTDKYSEKLK